jgi:hypothetical protein
MASIFIVLEATPECSRTIYPTTYKTLKDATDAIKAKWWAFLEENAATNHTSAEEIWLEAVSTATVEGNVVSLYLEKENFFEVHELPIAQ